MKKNIITIMTLLWSTFIHGMQDNNFSITSYETIINLTKGFLSKANVDIIVVGKHQQRTLQKTFIQFQHDKYDYAMYEKQPEYDSDSNDDTYTAHNHIQQNQLWKHAHKKTLNNLVMAITEPRIVQFQYHDQTLNKLIIGPMHHNNHQNTKIDNSYLGHETENIRAIETASKDLIVCYQNALRDGLLNLGKKKEKSIAFPPLSADVGFPRDKAAPIAVATILEFIKNNPYQYNRIELFVKKRSDYKRYEELLKNHYMKMQKALLLYYRQHNYIDFNLLPREVQSIILMLMITA